MSSLLMDIRGLTLATVLLASMTMSFAPREFGSNRSQRGGLFRMSSFPEPTVSVQHGSANLSPTPIKIAGRTINIEFAPGHFLLPTPNMIAWVAAAAWAVTHYYGHFPVREAQILIVPVK